MSRKKDAPFNNPFGKLTLEAPRPAAKAPIAAPRPEPVRSATRSRQLDDESALFLEAVGEVERVPSARSALLPPERTGEPAVRAREDAESLTRLAELVAPAGDFELLDADDRVEGSARGFDPNVMRRLRAGDFPTQASLDLHGRSREDAKLEVERFLHSARIAGHRCVLIVTGKGLHSPDQIPILKRGVQQWLSQGKPSRQVLGFCSARPKDGGVGAVYVLLRR